MAEQQIQSTRLEEMDNELRRYYTALGKGDECKAEDDSTMGQFEHYCQDNGLDLIDAFDAGAQEALILIDSKLFAFILASKLKSLAN